MGIGISTIWKANKRGGLKLSRDSEHVFGLFSAALGSGESENPFQDEGLGEGHIFDLAEEEVFQSVVERVKEIAERYEREELLALQKRPDNLTLHKTTQGEYALAIYVIDLELDDEYAGEIVGTQGGNLIARSR